MLRPLFIDMAQFLHPKVARFMSPIELGHSKCDLPLFAASILWRMVAQRLARLCGPENPLPLIPPHFSTTLISLFQHRFIQFSIVSSLLSASSLECLLFVGRPMQVACVPLISFPFLLQFQYPVLPGVEHPDGTSFLLYGVSRAWDCASFTILSPRVLFQLILLG